MNEINVIIDSEDFNLLSDNEKLEIIREAAKEAPDNSKVKISWIEREVVSG